MDLSALQAALDRRFGAQDRAAGLPFLTLVLQEEVGEFAEAVRRDDRAAAAREAVDVVFAALSVANAAGADVEAALRAKFLERPEAEVMKSWTDLPQDRGPDDR